MAGQGRQARCHPMLRDLFTRLLFGALISFTAIARGQMLDWPTPPSWSGDAELTDLFFVDANNGWVVGDRGIVLYTSDGGDRWHNKDLGVRCRWESVCFVDTMTGWIAGGFQFPAASSSQGVLFRTRDGGHTWQRVNGLSIPKLNQIRFQDAANGWAVGEANALHPSGIYTTRDGGKTWSAQLTGQLQHWQTGDRHGNRFIVAGQLGQIARCDNGELETAYFPDSQPVSVRRMQLADRENGFAVGERGAILTTKNGGLSWHRSKVIADNTLEHFDFRGLFPKKQSLWFAGSPGSSVFKFDRLAVSFFGNHYTTILLFLNLISKFSASVSILFYLCQWKSPMIRRNLCRGRNSKKVLNISWQS